MSTEKRGKFLVFSGPSGVGKGTIIRSLLNQRKDTYLAVSATTRLPRQNEIDGHDYYFMSEDTFKKNISEDAFVEYCLVHGNYYGTLKSEIESHLSTGRDVIIEIDVQGARKARKRYPELKGIFIKPPSKEELVKRLNSRATDQSSVIKRRLAEVDSEMAAMPEYDYVVENRDLDTAVNEVIELINKL